MMSRDVTMSDNVGTSLQCHVNRMSRHAQVQYAEVHSSQYHAAHFILYVRLYVMLMSVYAA